MNRESKSKQQTGKTSFFHGDSHDQRVDELFKRAKSLLKLKKASWRPMTGRKAPVNTAKDYSLGYTDLETHVITIDIYTPKHRRPKSLNGILRVLAHEFAHLQKPPFRQRHRGRWITRMHYPEFYHQVNKNIEVFKKDRQLGSLFKKSD